MPNFYQIFDLTADGKFSENTAWKRSRIRKTRQLNIHVFAHQMGRLLEIVCMNKKSEKCLLNNNVILSKLFLCWWAVF